ncbi:MAG: hypothetical protein R3A47_03465 [Polyangiales bacterium]
MRFVLLCIVLAAYGCVDSGARVLDLNLFVSGTAQSEPASLRSGWNATLERADLVFGPFTLCAAAASGVACESARAEWNDAVVVDTLRADEVLVGAMQGTTGFVGSWMYDLGFVSSLSQTEPFALNATQALDGASYRIEGIAQKGDSMVPFFASLSIKRSAQNDHIVDQGKPIVRRTGAAIEHELTESSDGLHIRFNPSRWLVSINFDDSFVEQSCASPERNIVCRRADPADVLPTLAHQCVDGELAPATDCVASEEFCVRDIGCVDRLELREGTQGAAAIRSAIVAGEAPEFEWSVEP